MYIAGIRHFWGRYKLKLRLILLGASAFIASTQSMAQDVNVDGRVTKLEKEMRAVQRQVFPGTTGTFFEPEIKATTPTKSTAIPSSTAVSDLITRVDALEAQLANITGQVEQQGNSMRTLDARLKNVEAQLKAQAMPAIALETAPATKPALVAPSTAVKPASVAKGAPATKASAARVAAVAAIEKPSSSDAFDDSYTYGYRLWDAKFYPEAQTQLQETVTKFPKHTRISFARNLLGRAWLDDKKPATAVKIFYDNYKLDPRGERAAESLYFLGSALTDLNKNAEACEAFGQVTSAYADEASGRLAARLAAARTRAKCK